MTRLEAPEINAYFYIKDNQILTSTALHIYNSNTAVRRHDKTSAGHSEAALMGEYPITNIK